MNSHARDKISYNCSNYTALQFQILSVKMFLFNFVHQIEN